MHTGMHVFGTIDIPNTTTRVDVLRLCRHTVHTKLEMSCRQSKYLEGAEMNEKGSFKSVIARDFVFKSKCMFGGRAPPGLTERA